jgi:MioC protein
MSFIRIGMNLSLSFLSWLPIFTSPRRQLKTEQKIHDYSKFISGKDYIFEWLNEDIEACMTGFSKDIKPGDYIILSSSNESSQYQVQEIDYYSNPPDMWMALLKRVIIK